MHPLDYVRLIGLGLEAIGILLLFREVRFAHAFEAYVSDESFAQIDAAKEEQADELDTRGARDEFARDLADWLVSDRGMATDAAYAHALKVLGLNQSSRIPSLLTWFKKLTKEREILARRGRLLMMGLVFLLGAVAIHALTLPFEKHDEPPLPPPPPPPVSEAIRFFPVPGDIAFDPAEALLTYVVNGKRVDLTESACKLKQSLVEAKSQAVLVIGRYDQKPLTPAATAKVTSNMGLAQRRADAVARYFGEDNKCGPALTGVISLVSGPRNVGAGIGESGLAKDRNVEVWRAGR